MTLKSYDWLAKKLGLIANAVNSNQLPRALHSIHFISKEKETTTTASTSARATATAASEDEQ